MMPNRVGFYLLAGIASFFWGILFCNQWCSGPVICQMETTSAEDDSEKEILATYSPTSQIEKPKLSTHSNEEVNDSMNEILEEVLSRQRKMIQDEMKDYQYPNGKYNISARKLEDLLIEEDGKPVRSVILTTWRSGSTFTGQIINSHPATFFHQEPLLHFDIVQIRGPPLAAEAMKHLRALLNCEYADSDDYIQFVKTDTWPLPYNTDFWKHCKSHERLCYKPEFFSGLCKLFPFQLTKLVRLSLNVAQELLADENLGVRMVLLVRDPRGTLQSRKHREWCPANRDCSDPALLCADLASDYKVAVELRKKYPTRFKVIRYEDLAAEPYESTEELSNFFGIDFHRNMKNYLDTHTKFNHGDNTATTRNSKTAPYHWRRELEFEEVEEIQRSCIAAMEYWGYVPATNATHQKEFNPVTDYTLTL